ncbi:RNA-binding domain-containing protein [Neoconidiobolus thromboides FSU 785]|nr:RNA-binding domain-containing protein [Neoconidiobolus thromboides FSU 785]
MSLFTKLPLLKSSFQTPLYTSFRSLQQKALYLGNIPFNLQREELEDLVSKYGTIYRLSYPTDPLGRFKGIAFVNYESSVADKVLEELNGAYIKGRSIKVALAKMQPGDEIVQDREEEGIAGRIVEKIEQDSEKKGSLE